jgi:hypothetical protein
MSSGVVRRWMPPLTDRSHVGSISYTRGVSSLSTIASGQAAGGVCADAEVRAGRATTRALMG